MAARLSAALGLVCAATGCDFLGPGPFHWRALDASEVWTCGIATGEGRAYCWGIAPGFTADVRVLHPDSLLGGSARPRLVRGAKGLVSISNQAGTLCAIDADRVAYCAGLNTRGQVGDSTGYLVARGGFTKVVGNHRWKVVHGTRDYSCGVTEEGDAFCWGTRHWLGNDTIPGTGYFPFPVPVVGGHTFETLGVGMWFTCALTPAGEAWCWGTHNGIYLGVGSALTENSSYIPVKVAGGHTFVSLTVAYQHACGVTASGEPYCWGYNAGRLGDGTWTDRGTPTRVVGDQKWYRLYAGGGFTCGLTTRYAVYCWGDNRRGHFMPRPADVFATPQLIFPAPGPYRDLAAGGDYVCGIRWNGMGECWGAGDWGQLGHGKREISTVPVGIRR